MQAQYAAARKVQERNRARDMYSLVRCSIVMCAKIRYAVKLVFAFVLFAIVFFCFVCVWYTYVDNNNNNMHLIYIYQNTVLRSWSGLAKIYIYMYINTIQ